MAKVEADVDVQRFAYESTEAFSRFVFPRAEAKKLEGRSGATSYGAADCAFEGLEGRLGTLRWKSDAVSAGTAWLRDDAGKFDLQIERAEFPHGLRLTRGVDHRVEIISPHVTFAELKLIAKGPFGRGAPGAATAASAPQPAPAPANPTARQEKLKFLD